MFARERRAVQEAEKERQGEVAQGQKAEQAQTAEVQLRQRAQTQELAARHRAYASDIRLAQQALAENNLPYAWELLSQQRPQQVSLIANRKSQIEADLRGWEWRYLRAQFQDEAQLTLHPKSEVIWSLAVSGDGKWLASRD